MSKGLGQKIGIRFTEKIVGDVTGLLPVPQVTGEYFRPLGTASGSSQYSTSYRYDYAFNGATASYWYTRTTGDQYVQIMLAEATFIKGFRWYVSNYRPDAFQLLGSNDNNIWDMLYTGNSPNVAGWYEFIFNTPPIPYKYYRWLITSRYESYVGVHEIELLSAVGNEKAFTVYGEEYQYVNGPLIYVPYKVISVERHPGYIDDKHLLLTVHPQGRFNDVEGQVTVSYDHVIGNMQGRGGAVEEFTQEFLPADLIPFPNPHASEIITVVPLVTANFIKIDYNHRYAEEAIVVTPNITATLTYVGVINP